MKSLFVSEIFGPTWQGEGPSAGRLAVFLRLGGCNLKCSWCDTPYTWDWLGESDNAKHRWMYEGKGESEEFNRVVLERNGGYDPRVEVKKMSYEQVASQLMQCGLGGKNRPILVITGGEPMLQQVGLVELLGSFEEEIEVEVETNGTIAPKGIDNCIAHFNVSPKLKSSGNSESKRRVRNALGSLIDTGIARFKFVVTGGEAMQEEFAEIESLLDEFVGIEPGMVWIMPEGIDSIVLSDRAKEVSEEVLKRGWNLGGRQHISLWGNVRGR